MIRDQDVTNGVGILIRYKQTALTNCPENCPKHCPQIVQSSFKKGLEYSKQSAKKLSNWSAGVSYKNSYSRLW